MCLEATTDLMLLRTEPYWLQEPDPVDVKEYYNDQVAFCLA